MIARFLSIIAFLVVTTGCFQRYPVNLTLAKQHVIQYHESGQYDRDVKRIITRTIKYFEGVEVVPNATVILDIDETLLSSFADQKSISFGYIPKLSHEWISKSDAPVIPETKRLYDYLVKRGFKIIFITGRKKPEYDSTVKNLKKHGIATFEKLILRERHETNITAEEYKSARRKKLTEEGYKIVGCIGDQWSDLSGGYTGYQVKLPNYTYMIP